MCQIILYTHLMRELNWHCNVDVCQNTSMCKCLYIITQNIHTYCCMGCVFGSTNCWMWYYQYINVYILTPVCVKSAIHATSIYMCWFFLLLLTQYKTQFVESIQFIAIENRLHRPVVSIKRHTCCMCLREVYARITDKRTTIQLRSCLWVKKENGGMVDIGQYHAHVSHTLPFPLPVFIYISGHCIFTVSLVSCLLF